MDQNRLAWLPTPLPRDLETLEVFCNPLGPANLPDLSQCTRLDWLAVCHTFLTVLPPLPPSVRTIHADGSVLTSLPELPPSLRSLNCKDNQLMGIDLSRCGRSLTEVCVSGNLITSLDFSPCTKLVRVEANDNELTSITNIDHLPLDRLDASGNMLTSLPALPPTLWDLWVDHNQLTEIPSPLPAKVSVTADGNPLPPSVLDE